MRVVVTGANGLVGSRLTSLLSGLGHTVTGLARGPSRLAGPVAFRSCDVTQAREVAKVFADLRPDAVVHCASMTDVDGCERDPAGAWAVNAAAAAHVATASRSVEAHLVHVSTDYVFDGQAGPYAEDASPNPRGVYAQTKYAGELAVRSLAGSWAIARTAVVYGWPPAGRPNFGSWLVTALTEKQPVKLFLDQFVSPSLADNVAEMLAEVAERRLPGVWNVAGAEVVDRVAYGRSLCTLFGLDASLIKPSRLADVKLASSRPARCGLKPDKALAELSQKPLPLAASLARFHAAWKAAPA